MNYQELSPYLKTYNNKFEKELKLKNQVNPNKTEKSKRQVRNLNKSF